MAGGWRKTVPGADNTVVTDHAAERFRQALAMLPPALRSRLQVTQQCRAEDIEQVRSRYAALGIPADAWVVGAVARLARLPAAARADPVSIAEKPDLRVWFFFVRIRH